MLDNIEDVREKEYTIDSKRVKRLRESVLSKRPEVCIERARYITEAYKKNEGDPIYLKRAKSVKNILENMSIYIKDGELIVGNQAADERTAPVFPEYAVDWMKTEIEEEGNFDSRPGDNFHLPEEDIDELLDIVDYWQGRTLKAKAEEMMPEEVKKASEAKVIHGEGNITSGDGHIVPDFTKALNKGLNGVIKEAEEAIEELEIGETESLKKKAFLESIIVINKSAIRFAERFSKLAEEKAQKEEDPERKKELEKIAEVCQRVPAKPPRDFYEAVQSVWFIHLLLQIESNGHSASLGRVDQYLYEYYKQDVLNGDMSREFAKELLECLWIKLYSVLKLRPTSHSGYGAGYPTYQNVTIGGKTVTERDQTNELSYLILESVAETKLTQPNLSARVHAHTPKRFLSMCAQVIKTGNGMPALHNDEIIIPSLLHRGVDYQDAYNYTMVGCVEVAVPGKWGYRCTGMTFFNMLKALELTLKDGKDPRTGYVLREGNGDLTDFSSFDELWEAWEDHVSYYTDLTVTMDHIADINLEELVPDILCSSLVNNCIERGKTVKEGGAVYDMVSGLQVGLANVANSFASLKKYVYEEEELSQEEVMEALENNFEGEKGAKIQKLFEEAPKYGNDIDYVDEMAVDAYYSYIKEIRNYKNTRHGRGPIGGDYYMSTSGISSNVPMGAVTGATPDGREAEAPTAEGASPVQGTDIKGPTAVLKSITKLPTILMTGGQLLNQKFPPELVEGDKFDRFISFLETFINLKAWHVQFNIVSSETLRAAQENPEEYRDLIVRVAGYCAQFVTLDKKTQNDIIARTEQNL